MDRIDQEIARAPWRDRSLAVLFFDLDRFKNVNDSFGHGMGDQLLRAIAERLEACVRDGDTVARMGGDEFVALLVDVAKDEDVTRVANRIIETVAQPLALEGQEVVITASIGISLYPKDGQEPQVLLKRADSAMYRAKESGKNNYQYYAPEMNQRVLDRLSIESGLRKALEREEFVLHYQPQIDMSTGKTIGVEALIRWQHPERGMVPPLDFLAVAEDSGLIVPISEWVLQTACSDAKEWHALGYNSMRIAVNVSNMQFRHKGFLDVVRSKIKETGIDPQRLELELTESIIMRNFDNSLAKLRELCELGIHLALDDFGTGHSSLAYLSQIPLSTVKLDKTFIDDLDVRKGNIAIVAAVVALAHEMDLRVVAEGIETEHQRQLLVGKGVDGIQGYLYSKPVPKQEFEDFLKVDSDPCPQQPTPNITTSSSH